MRGRGIIECPQGKRMPATGTAAAEKLCGYALVNEGWCLTVREVDTPNARLLWFTKLS